MVGVPYTSTVGPATEAEGWGLVVTTKFLEVPGQPLVVGIITYVAMPAAVLLGLVNVLAMVLVPLALLPVRPPVTVLVQVYVVPLSDAVGVKLKAKGEQPSIDSWATELVTWGNGFTVVVVTAELEHAFAVAVTV